MAFARSVVTLAWMVDRRADRRGRNSRRYGASSWAVDPCPGVVVHACTDRRPYRRRLGPDCCWSGDRRYRRAYQARRRYASRAGSRHEAVEANLRDDRMARVGTVDRVPYNVRH